MKRDKVKRVLSVLWRVLSAVFLMQSGIWVIAIGFTAYPYILDVFNKATPGESIFGPWVGETILGLGPLFFLLTFLGWSVFLGFKGMKRLYQ